MVGAGDYLQQNQSVFCVHEGVFWLGFFFFFHTCLYSSHTNETQQSQNTRITSHRHSSHETTELLSEPEGKEGICDISLEKKNSRLNFPGCVKVKRDRKNIYILQRNKTKECGNQGKVKS